jgi:membrane protease YdiL (CAAX protease family)
LRFRVPSVAQKARARIHTQPKKRREKGNWVMFTKLTETTKAATFTVLVLCLAVGAALLVRFLNITSDGVMFSIWSCTPTVATLIMLLVVTRDGYTKEGWKSLGLHRLGLNVWWIAFGLTLLITVAASAVVWATPLASFGLSEGGLIDPILSFFIVFGASVVWFGLAEEVGMRGYLQPRLMSLGKRRALFLVGLVFATWHMPLIFLASQQVQFPTGNLLLFFPLFYGTFIAASFFFGYMRIYTGSIWPASIAHSVHNAAWNVLGALTVITAAPVLVNVYLVGDFGILILIGSAIGAIWFGRRYKSGMDVAQSGAEVPRVAPAAPSAPAAPR